MSSAEQNRKEAVRWAVLTSDPDFDDWDAFAAWIDEDAGRNFVYEEAMLTVSEATLVLNAAPVSTWLPAGARPYPVADRPVTARPVGGGRWGWPAGGLALAASVAGMLLLARPADAPPLRVVDVPAGPPLRVALEDGSSVEVAGGGRLLLDPAAPRRATLVRGTAMFTVRHDAAAPFRVTAGEHEIVDLGTVFEVVQSSTATDVAVAEGAVVVDPSRSALRLAPGEAASLRDGVPARVSRVAPAAVGRWRDSRMSYREAPLPQVASDLSAALGRPVTVDPALRSRRFTGTLIPASLRDEPEQLAVLLAVRVRVGEGRWDLLPR